MSKLAKRANHGRYGSSRLNSAPVAGGMLAMAASLCALGPAVASPDWQWFNYEEPRQVFSIAADDTTLVAQGPDGLFRSRNHGDKWDSSLMIRGGDRITALARIKKDFFAATNRNIYLSGNAAISWTATWTRPASGAPAGNVIGFRSNGDSIWAVLAAASGPYTPGFRMLSRDGGRTWGAPLEWSGGTAYDPVPIGDSLLAVVQGALHCSRDGGKSWGPVPVDPDIGVITHVSANPGGINNSINLYAATAGGYMVYSWDQGKFFQPIPVGIQMWTIGSPAADGRDLCRTTGDGISCFRDGIPGTSVRDNPIGGYPNLTLGRGILYVTPSRDFSESGIWRADIAAGSWERLEAPKAFGSFAPMLSARDDTLLALSRNPAAPLLISLDRGETWDSLPGRPEGVVPDGFFQSEGIWGISGPGEDFNLTIHLSRDRGAHWSRFPSNPAALIRGNTVVAWDGHLYVQGDRGGLWKGDMQSGAWSLAEAPGSTLGYSLAATDRALYLLRFDGYWRLEKDLPVNSPPSARPSPARIRGTTLALPRNGSWGVRVIPGLETGVRPGLYDLKGARMRIEPR